MWVSEELKRVTYTNLKMSEVWQFDNYTQYDKKKKQGGFFSEYMDTFMKIKQESLGYPACTWRQKKIAKNT